MIWSHNPQWNTGFTILDQSSGPSNLASCLSDAQKNYHLLSLLVRLLAVSVRPYNCNRWKALQVVLRPWNMGLAGFVIIPVLHLFSFKARKKLWWQTFPTDTLLLFLLVTTAWRRWTCVFIYLPSENTTGAKRRVRCLVLSRTILIRQYKDFTH